MTSRIMCTEAAKRSRLAMTTAGWNNLREDLGSAGAGRTTTDNGDTHLAVGLEFVTHLQVRRAASPELPKDVENNTVR